MKVIAVILKNLSVQNFVLQNNNNKMAFYGSECVIMGSKTTPSLELFPFVKKLAGLIEEHLDLGPTTNLQVLKSTYLHKFLPKITTLVGPKHQFKKFVLTLSNCVETFRC